MMALITTLSVRREKLDYGSSHTLFIIVGSGNTSVLGTRYKGARQ